MARDFDETALPVRASGTFEEFRWEVRGEVVGDSVSDYVLVDGPRGGGGGGGVGPIPFADIGWKVLGAFGSLGHCSGGGGSGWITLHGAVATSAARVRVYFDNAEPEDAFLIDAAHPDVQFFFLITRPHARWNSVVALDQAGNELDRWVLPIGSGYT